MKITLYSLLFFISLHAMAQVGIGTNTPSPSAALDITSTDKALLIPRVANTAAITTPTAGMIVYDLSSSCVKAYQNGNWTECGLTTKYPTSGGTAVVSGYLCNIASTGDLENGEPVSGVTQTITAIVTSTGTYVITAVANGVTFSATGTFAGTGSQNVVLTATGTPTVEGDNTFVLNTTPSCVFTRFVNAFVPKVTSNTGRIWMDRNLGASQVATSSTDASAYGDLYQWGRKEDGHQLRNSTNASYTAAATYEIDFPGGSGYFFLGAFGDWLSPSDATRWANSSSANNPCPAGYGVPSQAEWNAEIASWSSADAAGAFASPLKLTLAGYRHRNNTNPALREVGVFGNYWSGTSDTGGSIYRAFLLRFDATIASTNIADTVVIPSINSQKRSGSTVRCIKDL